MSNEMLGIVDAGRQRVARYGHFAHAPVVYADVPRTCRITVNIATGERTIEREIAALKRERAELERAVGKLIIERDRLQSEVERLRREALAIDPTQQLRVGVVTGKFLAELESAGYLLDGEPMTLADLRGGRRALPWSKPRQVAMALCREIARENSLLKIGRFYHKDHSCVVHARQRVPEWISEHPMLREAALATCRTAGVAAPAWLLS